MYAFVSAAICPPWGAKFIPKVSPGGPRGKKECRMKRLFEKNVCGLTALVGVLTYGMARAEFDKDAEKAKKEKEAKPVMEGQDEQSHEDFHRRLAKEGEENLKEINRLLDEIQKSMAQKETGAGTQEKQRRAVERMESLIKELGKP